MFTTLLWSAKDMTQVWICPSSELLHSQEHRSGAVETAFEGKSHRQEIKFHSSSDEPLSFHVNARIVLP
jgi:hypothetical protein